MQKQLLITAISCLFFVACIKKNNSSPPPPPETVKGYFRGKLNGNYFNDEKNGLLTVSFNNRLHISGLHNTGGITLVLRPYTGRTGESLVNDSISISIGNIGGIFYAGFINGKIQGSGKINILEITNTFMRGTFEGIVPADSSYAILPTQFITEGEFKLKRQ